MKIPETIRVAGIEYAIEFVPGLNDGANVLCGEVTHSSTKIHINTSVLSHEMQCVTMWHELLHVLAVNGDLELGEKEENIINIFARGIYQILQDNGGLLFDLAKKETTSVHGVGGLNWEKKP